MNKENIVDEVLKSTQNMHRAEPSPFIFEKITAKIQTKNRSVVQMGNPKLRWGVAIVVSVLISVNTYAFLILKSESHQVSNTSSQAAVELTSAVVYNY